MSVLILALMMAPKVINSFPSYDLAYAVPGVLLILGLALSPDPGIARLLGPVALVALGELSYAFYLIHVPIGLFVLTDVFQWLHSRQRYSLDIWFAAPGGFVGDYMCHSTARSSLFEKASVGSLPLRDPNPARSQPRQDKMSGRHLIKR